MLCLSLPKEWLNKWGRSAATSQVCAVRTVSTWWLSFMGLKQMGREWHIVFSLPSSSSEGPSNYTLLFSGSDSLICKWTLTVLGSSNQTPTCHIMEEVTSLFPWATSTAGFSNGFDHGRSGEGAQEKLVLCWDNALFPAQTSWHWGWFLLKANRLFARKVGLCKKIFSRA